MSVPVPDQLPSAAVVRAQELANSVTPEALESSAAAVRAEADALRARATELDQLAATLSAQGKKLQAGSPVSPGGGPT